MIIFKNLHKNNIIHSLKLQLDFKLVNLSYKHLPPLCPFILYFLTYVFYSLIRFRRKKNQF